ncbi:NAD(P)H-dependent oxidoreductase subunit E [bacterium]|nr:NAD(P)H-dependent oxidoreductase subunit E [bacterium]
MADSITADSSLIETGGQSPLGTPNQVSHPMSDKLEIKVCVGSSCHVKGGSKTLRTLELLIEKEHLDSKVELKADLCLGNCLEAPNVVLDGQVHGGVTPEKTEEFFNLHILPRVQS